MSEPKQKNLIEASRISVSEVNEIVGEIIGDYNKILVMNPMLEKGLFDSLSGKLKNQKVEVIGNIGNDFGRLSSGVKFIVNGDVGNDAIQGMSKGKLTVYGSCGDNLGCGLMSSEVYVYKNCGSGSFSNMDENSNVVLGGQAGQKLGKTIKGGTIVLLNAKGGSTLIGDDFIEDFQGGNIYIRGKCDVSSEKFKVEETHYDDEDIYLPLISEYARLFGISLSEIKSKLFCKLVKA